MPRKKGLILEDSEEYSDGSEFQNSEDGYDSESVEKSYDDTDDSTNLEPDPDDDRDPNDDDKFDPVTEMPEPTDDEEEDENEEGEGDEEEEEDDDEEEDTDDDLIPKKEKRSSVCYQKDLNNPEVLAFDQSKIFAEREYDRVPDNERITSNIMTIYEIVRVLGVRAQQFNLGAKPLIQGVDHLPPPKMAYIELMSKQTPFIIRRYMPQKKYEEWKIEELEIDYQLDDPLFVPDSLQIDNRPIKPVSKTLSKTKKFKK